MNTQRKSFSLSAIAVAIAVSQPASSLELEEVIVTAQKRAESLQDVPISVSAISGDSMADAGIELIGIDYLSVELYDVPELPAHKAFMNAGITILEGINLSHVKPGDYTLVALPLKLDALDGTPGRAVLLQ